MKPPTEAPASSSASSSEAPTESASGPPPGVPRVVFGGFLMGLANLGAMTCMLFFGTFSDRSPQARQHVTLGALLCLSFASALLALAIWLESPVGLAIAGTLATSSAWTVSGQVTPLAKRCAKSGEESRMMSIIVSAWAVGALGGAQCHGHLAERYPIQMFLGFSVVLLMAWSFARTMFSELGEEKFRGG